MRTPMRPEQLTVKRRHPHDVRGAVIAKNAKRLFEALPKIDFRIITDIALGARPQSINPVVLAENGAAILVLARVREHQTAFLRHHQEKQSVQDRKSTRLNSSHV